MITVCLLLAAVIVICLPAALVVLAAAMRSSQISRGDQTMGGKK
jgi:hypothetical protein